MGIVVYEQAFMTEDAHVTRHSQNDSLKPPRPLRHGGSSSSPNVSALSLCRSRRKREWLLLRIGHYRGCERLPGEHGGTVLCSNPPEGATPGETWGSLLVSSDALSFCLKTFLFSMEQYRTFALACQEFSSLGVRFIFLRSGMVGELM